MPGTEDLRRALDDATDLGEVGQLVRKTAREWTWAQGATFVLREEEYCFYADEDAIAPLWKGQRFPMATCISGWAMLNNSIAIVPDIHVDDRIPIDAYRPTFVRSLIMVPVGSPEPKAAIGAYWSKPRRPRDDEVERIEDLAQLTGEAVARIGLRDAPWAPNFDRRTAEPA